MAAGNRKNELRALFSAGPVKPAETPPAAPETKSAPPPAELTAVNSALPASPEPQRAASGAVRAMGLSLGSITREAEEARQLRQALSDGERVLSLDPDLIDSSFVSDRLSTGDDDEPDFRMLVDSIRESGQQSPILVRPHPEEAGRYQTAYGHRRLGAVRKLGIKVKAIVRPLSDNELVLAQGKENAERRNLSFIERALFAKALSERGFDRKVVGDALSVDKTELSRLMQVAESVPERFVRAIGPAPKAGRNRWMAIGELLSTGAGSEKAADEIYSERFTSASSDDRFAIMFNRLTQSKRPEPEKPQELKDGKGRVFARLKRDGRTARIDFLPGIDPDFIEETATLLAERYAAFTAQRRS